MNNASNHVPAMIDPIIIKRENTLSLGYLKEQGQTKTHRWAIPAINEALLHVWRLHWNLIKHLRSNDNKNGGEGVSSFLHHRIPGAKDIKTINSAEGRSLYTNGRPQKNVQDNRVPLMETDDRHLCYAPELPGKCFLKLITRSRSSSYRFIHSSLAKKGTIFSPALEVDSENNMGFQGTKQYYTAVDTTVLVSFDLTYGALAAKYSAHEQVFVVGRWEVIQHDHVDLSIDLGISSFLS
ncbi:uncharacterized protein RHIMIDRAFT_238447 [Rhizopus microsporus ATCC 52813]|uniref:Uncharacterized protein n=1 Tax=Rhizopus microsporus ATCC 52813 TaxID=1340429 RepID=A0A2G4SSP1_RHIZD|nr:uncharacterized protein RHIMIDRAFT_238447 [Rhizopus microsporus ATCC 52813]PHZ11784.1 hypothetical protein RHIMIDRAFT_238447 [Rhizopus microsporus ATCC 52813]